jgi:hypothetical protein
MMKSRIICILLLLVGASGIYAQSLTVTGKVVDNEGLEVIGGNVTVKGKQNTGTITDINGKYTITVSDPQKDVLVFSFIGLENMEVPVKGRKHIDVTMKAASVLLDEVVAIGYATVKRKDLTGSVASVRSDDLLKVPSSDVTQALAGRMQVCRLYRQTVSPVLRCQCVFVAVYQLRKATNRFILSTDFRRKMACPALILPILKVSTC